MHIRALEQQVRAEGTPEQRELWLLWQQSTADHMRILERLPATLRGGACWTKCGRSAFCGTQSLSGEARLWTCHEDQVLCGLYQGESAKSLKQLPQLTANEFAFCCCA